MSFIIKINSYRTDTKILKGKDGTTEIPFLDSGRREVGGGEGGSGRGDLNIPLENFK